MLFCFVHHVSLPQAFRLRSRQFVDAHNVREKCFWHVACISTFGGRMAAIPKIHLNAWERQCVLVPLLVTVHLPVGKERLERFGGSVGGGGGGVEGGGGRFVGTVRWASFV